MTTYYVEREFAGRKVAVIDADSEEEALSIARNSGRENGVPLSGLTLDRHTCRWDEPCIVESGSVELRRKLQEFASTIKGGIITEDQEPPVEQDRAASMSATYYFAVPFTGQAVFEIKAADDSEARRLAQSASIKLGRVSIESPVVSYSLKRGDPVMVRPDLS